MATGSKVAFNFLGNSGMKVSNICLGTMTFGKSDEGAFSWLTNGPRQTDEALSHKILDKFVELGGNFIDTANIYTMGNSEKIIGNWLKRQNRDEIILATKVRSHMSFTDPNACGLSRKHIVKSCDDSLRRLQTDYIDLYQAHLWDDGTPIEETVRVFNDLIQTGKIRYYGFSNVCGWQLQKIVDTAKMLSMSPPVSLQQQYSLMQRHSESEEFMVCENEGIGVLPWSPLNGGLLTGKLKKNAKPDADGSRAGYINNLQAEGKLQANFGQTWNWEAAQNNDSYWKLMSSMEKAASNHGKTVPQVALRWLLQRKVVTSVIIGATSVQQLEDNMGASTGWELNEEEMKELTDAMSPVTPYPYDVIWASQGDRCNPFKK